MRKAGLLGLLLLAGAAWAAPEPISQSGQPKPVNWWFTFKFNAKSFPQCGGDVKRVCTFGGLVQPYKAFSQQYVFAASGIDPPGLQKGPGCVGETAADPVGATFGPVYKTKPYFVIWNDQFYGDPQIKGCSGGNCDSPWGHSKGMVAWDDSGDGVIMQVSTPSWPGAGSSELPRAVKDGNTLGCVADNDVMVSQHFFALRLNKDDLLVVLQALQNASVATDPKNAQIVHNGGPADVQALVNKLGVKSDSKQATISMPLSTGARVISKPSALNVPPWQMVSALLGGVPLRTATWWAKPFIPSTTGGKPNCWSDSLGEPGAVEIATSGSWQGTTFGLRGGLGPDFNHAKLGVSTQGDHAYAIFGDMNQQGTLDGIKTSKGVTCASSQNGRGGLFFVIEDSKLHDDLSALIKGDTAPTTNAN